MIKVTDPANCFGCSACKAVCPVGAIRMTPDKMGFPYPEVNQEACIECGKCERICSSLECQERSSSTRAFALRLKDRKALAGSQSGGAFRALSDVVLAQGGVIYGSSVQDDFCAGYERAEDAAGRDRMRGSKYIQSRIGDSLDDAVKDLMDGRKVLFTGTPCQCRALKALVDARPGLGDNLFLADLVCYGVPSPAVWREYLKYISEGRKPLTVKFRDKSFGWKGAVESVVFEDGSVYSSRSYSDIYFKHLIMRPSCANCADNNPQRVTDITIGDLWGLEKKRPDFYEDNLGWSLVLVHTPKGEEILKKASEYSECQELDLADCLQVSLRERVVLSPDSENFARDLEKKGMRYVLHRYGDRNIAGQWKYARKKIRLCIRKMIGRA